MWTYIDSNTSDKEWNPQVLERLHQQFEQVEREDGLVYVVDSAAFTQQTLTGGNASEILLDFPRWK